MDNLAQALLQRRKNLAQLIDFPVILWSGGVSPRNFPANHYPFRASSHFLYFAGLQLENAALRLHQGRMELFINPAGEGSALWQGETPKPREIAETIGADAVYTMNELILHTAEAATIPVQDAKTYQKQMLILDRAITPAHQPTGSDLELTKAIIALRLCHDAAALGELRQAAAVTVKAHQAGREAVTQAATEAEVRAVMEAVLTSHQMTCAYSSIVTVQGEVLHNNHYHHSLQLGDLILIDVGAETRTGWAGDVTRTWAVSGRLSPTQQAIYDVVLAAHDACIEAITPGVEYETIHFLAAQILAQGLGDLGILKGKPEDLVAQDAHALFFPHGIGHLLGLDVHDMEDLGDLAGYAPGRSRSGRFGLKFLRLHRPLQPGMVVTIEPGFYQVPGILNHAPTREKYQEVVDWDCLAKFADVRGIRIEDDILVTATGREVLTIALETR
jgi:Xaa-Pro aminopeptidase